MSTSATVSFTAVGLEGRVGGHGAGSGSSPPPPTPNPAGPAGPNSSFLHETQPPQGSLPDQQAQQHVTLSLVPRNRPGDPQFSLLISVNGSVSLPACWPPGQYYMYIPTQILLNGREGGCFFAPFSAPPDPPPHLARCTPSPVCHSGSQLRPPPQVGRFTQIPYKPGSESGRVSSP